MLPLASQQFGKSARKQRSEQTCHNQNLSTTPIDSEKKKAFDSHILGGLASEVKHPIFCFWKLALKLAPSISQLLSCILFFVFLEILANEKTNGKFILQLIVKFFPIATNGLESQEQQSEVLGNQFWFVPSPPLQYHKTCHWDSVTL